MDDRPHAGRPWMDKMLCNCVGLSYAVGTRNIQDVGTSCEARQFSAGLRSRQRLFDQSVRRSQRILNDDSVLGLG